MCFIMSEHSTSTGVTCVIFPYHTKDVLLRGLTSTADDPHHLPELLLSIILFMSKSLLAYFTVIQKLFDESS